MVMSLLDAGIDVHFMRDPTRGGMSAVTNEIALGAGYSLRLDESDIPVTSACKNLSEILGLELLDIANEGKMIFFVGAHDALRALKILKKDSCGTKAAIIGEVMNEKRAKVYLKTSLGGSKILGMPLQEAIPRIC
jgi:hydrogenase expression/formation protein HypE